MLPSPWRCWLKDGLKRKNNGGYLNLSKYCMFHVQWPLHANIHGNQKRGDTLLGLDDTKLGHGAVTLFHLTTREEPSLFCAEPPV